MGDFVTQIVTSVDYTPSSPSGLSRSKSLDKAGSLNMNLTRPPDTCTETAGAKYRRQNESAL